MLKVGRKEIMKKILKDIEENNQVKSEIATIRQKLYISATNEMQVHVEIARDLGYWNKDFCENLLNRYKVLGCRLAKLRTNWKTF